ncbi:MAG: hypothetical protein ACI8WT_004121 [Clostridium sp.]|jgi:hypothetical protein
MSVINKDHFSDKIGKLIRRNELIITRKGDRSDD